jgi:hypothetical protein
VSARQPSPHWWLPSSSDETFRQSVYQYLRRPDLAVILTGDPAVCRARAAVRGVYSRFHEGGSEAGAAETALYAGCAGLLAGRGYPVSIMAIGDRTAAQVAVAVIDLIEKSLTAHPQR